MMMNMPLKSLLLATLTVLVLAAPATGAEQSPSDDPLVAGFRNPPNEARPSAYWLWLNGYVNREHVERELQELHDAGIRGVCIFDMGARGDKTVAPPAGPPFMSDRSVEDIAHAVQFAGRLGMDVELSVASSWDMGGSWVEPRHGSMGLFHTEVTVEGPRSFDEVLPFPPLPAKAPKGPDGKPAFYKDVAVLAVPAKERLPGHDFVFELDPPGVHTLSHAVLYNISSDDPKHHGKLHLFTKEFSIAVSETAPTDGAFREVLRASLEPNTEPQRFDLPSAKARYVRLRILSGHNERFDRVQLGEFELFDTEGINVVASHVADRSRDGAELIGYRSALGHDRTWTAGNIHDGAKSGAHGGWSSAGPPPLLIKKLDSIIDLTDRIDDEGRLKWQAPAGQWVIMRFVCTNTGERLKVPSPSSDGLATDHLSREATLTFLTYLTDRLQTKLGDLSETALKYLYLASYEVRGSIWTPDLIEQFEGYRGYDMKPYLPTLSGSVVVSDEVTARFIYDYRKTLGDLLVDAYYRAAVEAARAVGLGIESEAGGPGPPIHQVPVDALKAQGAIDEVRGEFWPKRPDANRMWVVKETACAAHIYGKRRVHMEAFTSMHHWQDGPFDLKPSADRACCEGTNHFVWHTSSHLPPEAGKPGWVYHAGTHVNPNLVWWPKAKPFLDYLARCSFLLQQGLFVADVCYYYGDQGYNFVLPKHTDPLPGYGYDFDVTNREVILTRMSVRDGRIVLPDGMGYALLVLPDRQDIDLDVLKKLEQLVRDGAIVVGPKPTRANGLTDYPRRDDEVRRIADRLWGDCDGETVLEHTYGKGRVIWGRTPRDVLKELGVGPDFRVKLPRNDTDLDFIHRRTPDADIYFIRNKKSSWEQVGTVFRVEGRVPELWDPASGQITPHYAYRATDEGVSVSLRLAPYGSVFVVFRAPANDDGPAGLPLLFSRDDKKTDHTRRDAVFGFPRVVEWDGRQAKVMVLQTGSCRVGGPLIGDAWPRGTLVSVSLPEPIELAGPWEVRFADALGTAHSTTLDRLISWTEHPKDEVRYFSGIGRYHRSFDLPKGWLADDRRVFLDVGRLWAVGEVFVNGRSVGVLWKPSYVVDITDSARSGTNNLVVEVANTWSNRLAGDARLPEDERRTRTNVLYTGGHSWKNTPLLESGLFGPVRILPAKIVSVTSR